MEIVRKSQKDPVYFKDLVEGDLFLDAEMVPWMKMHSFAEGDVNAVNLSDAHVFEFSNQSTVIPVEGKLVLED
jgi:hypothetical protein